jgi:GntR family transcriptional regulator
MPAPPAWRRIAALLRDQIAGGQYPAGSRLPSLRQIAEEHSVSDIVARRAMAALVEAGLVEGRPGSGYYVRGHRTARRIANTRYRLDIEHRPEDDPATSFTRDRDLAWEDYTLDRTFTTMPVPDDIAVLMQLDPGDLVLRREFVFRATGHAEQISTTYLPWSLVEGTPVADPEREPWPGGTAAQAASLGHPITRVQEDVTSRMPMPEEAELLEMPPGTPVFAITRCMLASELVVELAHIVLPADRVVLSYTTDL